MRAVLKAERHFPLAWMRSGTLSLVAIAGLAGSAPVAADEVADFYSGKTVTVVVASGPGGNHTIYSQVLAPYLKKYTPGNPNFVVKNLPGAGGIKAANYLYNKSPRDGSEIAILLSGTALASRLQPNAAKYNPREFQYLAGADYTRDTLVVWKKSGIKSIEDAKQKTVIIGASGRGSKTYVVPTLANAMLGTKFKVVTGYPGIPAIELAMERGEVQGRVGVWASVKNTRPHWIKDDLINHLFVADTEREPELPDVPTLAELVSSPKNRKVVELITGNGVFGRAWLAPPAVPEARLASLRTAFEKSLADPAFLAEAKERKMAIQVVPWKKLEAAVVRIADADDDTVAAARELLGKK